MERIVSNGYRDCTVILDGTECKVTFDHCYRAFVVLNDSTEDVFVSIEQGKNSGEDGVRHIAPGCSSVLAHMRTDIDTVYVTGSGSVQIAAQNGTENPFKFAALGDSSGGGISAENIIDDTQPLSDKTYSSEKIEDLLGSIECSLLTKTQEVTSDNVPEPVLTDINIATNSKNTASGFQLLAIQYTNVPERSLYIVTNIIGSLYWQPISAESTNITISKGSNASLLTVTGGTGGSFKVSIYDVNLP